MAVIEISIQGGLQNISFQVGDVIWRHNTVEFLGIESVDQVGEVLAIFPTGFIHVQNDNIIEIEADDFLLFTKNNQVNNTSLTGYYASVELQNNSTDKVELFALSSEATPSSK